MKNIKRLIFNNQRGQGAIEYGLITLVVILSIVLLAQNNTVQTNVSTPYARATTAIGQIGSTVGGGN